MQIQPTILRFAKMLASVLQLEVEIVDANLVRVAGTGPFGAGFGRKLEGDSRLLRYVMEHQTEKVVTQSREDPVCEGCPSRDSCTEMAFLGVPIMVHGCCIGAISLVALAPEQQARLRNSLQEICDYVRHVSNIFVSKLLDSQEWSDDSKKVFLTLMMHMDQGCLLLDEQNQVLFANEIAQQQLHYREEELIGQIIGLRPLTFGKLDLHGPLQHVFSQGAREELVIGQLFHVQGQQLFLMTTRQSNDAQAMPRSRQAVPEASHIDTLIGDSKPMLRLKTLIHRIAQSPSSVMIRGESGTGKEVVAQAIHRLGPRSEKPFIAINCAAIPEQLLESELFGYTKGAFTGASSGGKQGLIQAAHQGTLFLDEIGDMPLTMQAKLLRVLELREVTPIGASRPSPVDIRVIAATHQHLDQFIQEGKFREDLFYRVNVIPIDLPPLRDREGDIDLLIHYFLNQHIRRIGSVYPGMTDEAKQLLRQYRWPGNVRELSNLMEYLVNIIQDGEVIDSTLLPPNLIRSQATPVLQDAPRYQDPPRIVESITTCSAPPEEDSERVSCESGLESMEKQMIEETLSRFENKKLAAQALGIGIATLYRKIKKYAIEVPE
jgi:transcriptional regulator with PAS, ATPase and Fis domain